MLRRDDAATAVATLYVILAGLLAFALPGCNGMDRMVGGVPPPAPAAVTTPAPAVTAAPVTPPPSPLTVACRAEPRSGEVPLTVQFVASVSGGTGSYDFEWRFGDGERSTQVHPTHTYTSAGVFDASVTVTSGADVRACERTITTIGQSLPPAPAPSGPPTPLPDLVITIVANNGGLSYSPSLADARVGQHVVWRNADVSFHTATANGGAFDTGVLAPSATSARILVAAPGTFPYHCSIHPTMVATLRVSP